jgi:hypothetical protein
VGFGLCGMGLGLAPSPWLAATALVVAGVMWVWVLSTLNATAQLLAAPWVRGRVMSLYTLSFMGLMPLGSIGAGVVASAIGPGPATTVLCAGTLVLGAVVRRLPLPVLEDVISPQATESPLPEHTVADAVEVGEGAVMVTNTWTIRPQDRAAFVEAMDDLRRVRLRTGAYRWRLYRNVGDPHRMTEVFLLHSWEQHLRPHARIDAEAAEVIARARSFDRADGPITHHLAAVDVADPEQRPGWEALVAVHETMHRVDGSIPLPVLPDPDARAAGGR